MRGRDFQLLLLLFTMDGCAHEPKIIFTISRQLAIGFVCAPTASVSNPTETLLLLYFNFYKVDTHL